MSDSTNEENNTPFQVIAEQKLDLSEERVYCVYCNTQMEFLDGMPIGHSQWNCEQCGSTVYEGYGDTPARDAEYKTVVSINEIYPFDLPYGDTGRALLRDIQLDESAEENKPPSPYDKPRKGEIDNEGLEADTAHLASVDFRSFAKKNMRYPMRYYYSSPEEATKAI